MKTYFYQEEAIQINLYPNKPPLVVRWGINKGVLDLEKVHIFGQNPQFPPCGGLISDRGITRGVLEGGLLHGSELNWLHIGRFRSTILETISGVRWSWT